jgi:hypothetical protein
MTFLVVEGIEKIRQFLNFFITIACRSYRLIEGMLSLRAIDNVKLMISSWLLLGCGLSAK